MALKFCAIASGSSGNSVFVGTKHTKVLIDAGLSGKRITEGLASLNITGEAIDALFITHEHTDHIKGVGVFSRKFDIPIYATIGTWEAIENQIGKIAPKNKRFVYEEEPCVINDVCLCPFSIPHDAKQPVGYSIEAENHKITIATDLGHITDDIKQKLFGSKILLLEANHDVNMLETGSYPYLLKRRILSDKWHLSNELSGRLLAEIFHNGLKYIFLGHLSKENNFAELAYETVKLEIASKYKGNEIPVQVARRDMPSQMVLV